MDCSKLCGSAAWAGGVEGRKEELVQAVHLEGGKEVRVMEK